MQSRKMSFVESCCNVAIGYLIAVAAQYAIFPLFDIHIAHSEHFAIAALFTVVSLIRSYALRRLFNRWHQK